MLAQLGAFAVTAIPVCARDGDNVTAPSTRMPWYQGTTLLRALESAEPAHDGGARPFRMPVQLVNRPDHTFRGYAGTVAAGTLRAGRRGGERHLARRGHASPASSPWTATCDEARAGQPVTLVLDREIDVSRGDVLAAAPLPELADQIDGPRRLDGRNAAVPRPRLSGDARHAGDGRHGHRHHARGWISTRWTKTPVARTAH